MLEVPHAPGSGLLYAGLEAGGTKCVCAVGTGPNDLRACVQFATTTPSETMARTLWPFWAYSLRAHGPGACRLWTLDLAPTPHRLALSPPHRNWLGPTLTWWGRSAGPGLPVRFRCSLERRSAC